MDKKDRLAQSEPEPVATLWQHGETGRTRVVMNGDITDCGANWIRVSGLYTASPQREWIGLTDEEMFSLWVKCPAETEDRFAFARAIEQALKEKNT